MAWRSMVWPVRVVIVAMPGVLLYAGALKRCWDEAKCLVEVEVGLCVGDFVPASALWSAKNLKAFINWTYGDWEEIESTGEHFRVV